MIPALEWNPAPSSNACSHWGCTMLSRQFPVEPTTVRQSVSLISGFYPHFTTEETKAQRPHPKVAAICQAPTMARDQDQDLGHHFYSTGRPPSPAKHQISNWTQFHPYVYCFRIYFLNAILGVLVIALNGEKHYAAFT